MELWTAFTIGLVGSLHCIGMCGPIALALPYQAKSKWRIAGNTLLYNFGRVVTYSLMGVVIGLIGKGLFMAGYQSILSIVLGVILLIIALFSIQVESKLLSVPIINRLSFRLKSKLGSLLKAHFTSSIFLIGILNGLLPCGLVYMAIAGAVSTGSIMNAMFYMVLFGMGTIPMMLSLSLAGHLVSIRLRNFLRKLVPVFLVFFAILFISRGLHFDVPIDLRLWQDMQNVPMCH
ncbi:MAG: sulfite exporter TauE/SafE family protein [Bacteroidetes bacterium]|nr:sulfite exporter TauE/SafE family protein [Bacteroidota bacterium]